MTSYVQHKGPTGPLATQTRGLSARIWGRLPIKNWSVGLGGRYFFDDFMNHPAHISTQTIGSYGSYISSGTTLKQSATESTGAIEIATGATDNNEGSIISGGGAGGMVKIDADGSQRIAFECRFKKASIADDGLAFFVGLSEEGSQGNNALADTTGIVADKDFIGFSVLHDNGEEVDFTWRTSGAAVQVHANIATMVADTYMKMGFLYDPVSHPNEKKIKIFIDNGVEESVYVTQTQLDAATFPDGEELCLFLVSKIGTAAEVLSQMDWWALGVED